MFWRIGTRYINTQHIAVIDLDTVEYDYDVSMQVPAITISLTVPVFEFGQIHNNTGSGEPLRLVYKCNQADFLRPLIVKSMSSGGVFFIDVDLPELVLPEPADNNFVFIWWAI